MQPAPPAHDLNADYTPRYVLLARRLREWIEDGTYPYGALLPSAKRLAEAHDVSASTAIHALGMLASNGYARYVVGKPYQVIYGA
jgi:GntR family trehalose operon transcriptional repressor